MRGPGRFAPGTRAGTLARIGGALALLVATAGVLGALRANGVGVSWGVFGSLAGAVVLYCAATWRRRRTTDLGPQALQDVEALLGLIEEERVMPPGSRPSGADNDALFHLRDLAELARNDLSYGFDDRASETMLEIRRVVRGHAWPDSAPLALQVARLAELGQEHLDRRNRPNR